MAGTSQVNGIYTANISKVHATVVANIGSISGTTWVSTAGTPYNDIIDYSCMFDSSSATKLSYTNAAAMTDSTIGTLSMWVKRSTLGTIQQLCQGYVNSNNRGNLVFNASDQLYMNVYNTGALDLELATTQVFRDCSGWYHIYVSIDTSDATAADRVKFYVNGSRITDFDTEDTITQNNAYRLFVGSSNDNYFGVRGSDSDRYFDGYLSEVYFVDGSVIDVSQFGETEQGIWVPKTPTIGAYGNYGIHLDFATDTNFGDDTSGNGNDYTDTNFGTDHQVTDNPENNCCTLDDNNRYTTISYFREGASYVGNTNNDYRIAATTFLLKSGKWYWEVERDGSVAARVLHPGIMAMGESSGDLITTNIYVGQPAQGFGIHGSDGNGDYRGFYNATNQTGDMSLGTPADNDVIMIAFDADANKIWFGVGGTWYNSGNPAAGTNATFDSTDGIDAALYDYVPAISMYNVNARFVTGNNSYGAFTHAAPSGFNALCTENMNSPSVPEPTDAIHVVGWAGDDGATKAITGVGFQPDFTWIKCRDVGVAYHQLYDSVRGANAILNPNVSLVEYDTDTAGYLSAFDADGFTLTDGSASAVRTHATGRNYVAWCLKKGATYGFDIQTFTGTGVAHAENHDLGIAPELIIVKNRTAAAREFITYHHAALNKTDPETDRGLLDTSDAWSDLASAWNDVAPTTTQFTVGTNDNSNELDESLVAYLWASIDGFSKVFSYEGNGNAAGPYVYCGFRPKWIWFKNADGAHSWRLYDTTRNPYNGPSIKRLLPDTNAIESTADGVVDLYSNGFKFLASTAGINTNNNTYVGIAFADQPFRYANAR
jgi:hypothetical protein